MLIIHLGTVHHAEPQPDVHVSVLASICTLLDIRNR